MKQVICTVCPRGCEMEVTGTVGAFTVHNNGCARGETYAKSECTQPMRLFTSLVRVEGGCEPVAPVRSTRPIPREKLFACVEALRELTLQAPVAQYQVVLGGVFGTEVDLVTSAAVEKSEPLR